MSWGRWCDLIFVKDTGSSTSSSACTGWFAALCAVLAWGSFGVPLRHISLSSSLEVSPLILQSYKTLVCFVTSFLFVSILDEPLVWSWYGVLSGLFWVPGATAGVYGIRNAGLAVAVGTWSSLIVITSSFFGVVVFHEPVRDAQGSACALLTLLTGLIGMAKYSSPVSAASGEPVPAASGAGQRRSSAPSVPLRSLEMERRGVGVGTAGGTSLRIDASLEADANPSEYSDEDENHDDGELTAMLEASATETRRIKDKAIHNSIIRWGPLSLTKRQWGILGAVVNGAWGGMNLIPLHYAKKNHGMSGASYVVSFAGGAVIVNSAMFLLLYLYYVTIDKDSWSTAYSRLPQWHVREMGGRGLLAGILYSVGNFSSIVAVTHLGQGTGYSACQMQLLVSGLWGVFYFREIKSVAAIMKWFVSAATAFVGILWLAYERE